MINNFKSVLYYIVTLSYWILKIYFFLHLYTNIFSK